MMTEDRVKYGYMCDCCLCGEVFMGYKREVSCPRCKVEYMNKLVALVSATEVGAKLVDDARIILMAAKDLEADRK